MIAVAQPLARRRRPIGIRWYAHGATSSCLCGAAAAAGIIGEADALATAAARLLHTPALRGLPVKEGIARLRSTRLENDREPALSQTHKGIQQNRR